MPRQILPSLVLAVSFVIAGSAFAEVVIERSTERIEHPTLGAATTDSSSHPFGGGAPDKGVASPPDIFLPFLIDDTTPGGTTTFLSIRHGVDSDTPINTAIGYYDEEFNLIDFELVSLDRYELVSRNLNTIANLVNPGGIQRGFAIIETEAPIFTDYFLLDDDGNFATGSQTLNFDEFCDGWMVRFLRFGIDDLEGSKLTFIVNGPMGSDPADPPTIFGDVFDEGGNFLNSFTLRTDDWSFEAAAADLAIGSDFGTMRLFINSEFSDGGIIFVQHSAFGRFSVGAPAECFPLPL